MMEKLATKMMISGYPADFRRGVIESAVKCYEAQLAASAVKVGRNHSIAHDPGSRR